MSLATRCTSCGTIFRVVQDQLRVSDGWVRCGRCDAVFLATESLFDLDHDAPPSWAATEPPPIPPPVPPSAGGPPPPPGTAPGAGAAPDPSDRPASAEATLRALSAAAAAGQASVDARADAHAAATGDADAIVVAPERPVPSVATEPTGVTAAAVAPPETPRPAFIERARREAFWQRGRVRALLGFVALALFALLALQATRQFSDLLAARWPALRTGLAPWCRATGCSLAAPRRIEAILVESTALTPDPGSGALRLSVGLRNRAAHAVALPSIDLSLTDPTGRLIARRTLQPRDFRVDATDLPAHADVPLRLLLSAGGEPVSGYSVEIFYP